MWADEFVGLPHKERGRARSGIDCYGITWLVLGEKAGKWFPRFDDEDPKGSSILSLTGTYSTVELKDARAFDVAVLFTDVLVGLAWKSKPIHMGIFVDAKNILHIEEGVCSRIEPTTDLRIHSIVRVT